MRKEMDKKNFLHSAMSRIEGGYSLCDNSLCEIDTIIRIDEDDDKKLYDCKYCVFKDMLVCPHKIKEDIKYVLNLR